MFKKSLVFCCCCYRPGAAVRPPPLVRPGTATATQQPTQAARPAVSKPVSNNKFVCGVKGTNRELRSLTVEGSFLLFHPLHILACIEQFKLIINRI